MYTLSSGYAIVQTFFTIITGVESLGGGILNIQDFNIARGAAGTLFGVIDKVTLGYIAIHLN